MAAPFLYTPPAEFAEVARGIVRYNQDKLNDGSLFKTNIPIAERSVQVFESALDEFTRFGAIVVGDVERQAIVEEFSLTEHMLSPDPWDGELVAHSLGYDDDGVAVIRRRQEVLAPLVEQIRGRRAQTVDRGVRRRW